MSKTSPRREGITAVVPVFNAADRLDKLVSMLAAALERLDRPHEILVVDDGSTDAIAPIAEKLAGRIAHFRLLKHDYRKGFGACLRTALEQAQHPLFFYTAADYPYTPSDLKRLVERIDVCDEFFHKQPDLISGCRTGQHAPAWVKWFGRAWRFLWRVAAGMKMQPRLTWLGWRDYRYNALVGTLFGTPLVDVNSAFKLYRTAFLKRFPIQSDGDFVHTELVAKATFLTSIMDEIPLTPKPDAAPQLGPVRTELIRLFKDPDFGTPQPMPPAPEQPVVGAP